MDEIVRNYVSGHLIPGGNITRCVDGRYLEKDAQGTLARPGGAFGYTEALLGLDNQNNWGRNPEFYFDALQKVLSKIQGTSICHFHSDEHSSIGCGHAAKAADPQYAPQYGVNPEAIKVLYTYALGKAKRDQGAICVYLKGAHREQAVLINDITSQTIAPQDPAEGLMYFVYDRKKDREIVELITGGLSEYIPELRFNEFWGMLSRQTEATLALLAAGLPQYEIRLEEGELIVRNMASQLLAEMAA